MPNNQRPVVKCDKLSMKIVAEYPSAWEAEKANGYGPAKVAQICEKKSVSHGKHVYRYADEYDPNETFEGKFNRPVAMYDAERESLLLYESLGEAAKAIGYNQSTVSASISNGTMVGKRFVFKYAR